MWRNLPIAAFALFAPSLAAADADSDVLAKAKLVGHWAQDCAKAPANDNAHIIYVAPADGPPTEQLLMGGYMDLKTTLSGVKQLAPDKIEYQNPSRGEVFTIVKKIDGDRIKTWSSSVKATSEVYVKDGNYTQRAGSPPWMTRCPIKAE